MAGLQEIRDLLPGGGTPEGMEVLIWVLKQAAQPRPLKDIYRSSRFSEPTIRRCLRRLVDQGLVTVEASDEDERVRYARPTPRLMSTAEACQRLFIKAAESLVLETRTGLNLAEEATLDRTQIPPERGSVRSSAVL